MIKLPRLETHRLVVRPPLPEDLKAVVGYFRENREFHAPWSPLATDEFFREHYWAHRLEEIPGQFEREERMTFCFFANEDLLEILAPDCESFVCGHAQLSGFMRGPAQFCYLGYALAEKAQGRGLMEEGLRAIIDFAFEELQLHRIQANYMPHNRRSGKLLKRLGFAAEGYARDYLKIAGEWEDHVLTALRRE